jgi:hypothetical protein
VVGQAAGQAAGQAVGQAVWEQQPFFGLAHPDPLVPPVLPLV